MPNNRAEFFSRTGYLRPRYSNNMISLSVANPYDFPLDFQGLKAAARAVLEGEHVTRAKVTLAFVTDPHIHRLNKQYLDHDEPTDVLTFPYSGLPKPNQTLEGEVIIGYETAKEYAADRGHAHELELTLYVIHGCLHLAGYDDTNPASTAIMREREQHYLTLLNLPNVSGDA